MDFEWEDRFRDLSLRMKPNDYWRWQCKATFQFDRIGTELIDDMGVETIMWGSDYPHADGFCSAAGDPDDRVRPGSCR
jgi:predicted TIM-barrel fold metal-dependent hydrolase